MIPLQENKKLYSRHSLMSCTADKKSISDYYRETTQKSRLTSLASLDSGFSSFFKCWVWYGLKMEKIKMKSVHHRHAFCSLF